MVKLQLSRSLIEPLTGKMWRGDTFRRQSTIRLISKKNTDLIAFLSDKFVQGHIINHCCANLI